MTANGTSRISGNVRLDSAKWAKRTLIRSLSCVLAARQAHSEHRALARLTRHRDVAAHHLTEAPTDHQAESRAAVLARVPRNPNEALALRFFRVGEASPPVWYQSRRSLQRSPFLYLHSSHSRSAQSPEYVW